LLPAVNSQLGSFILHPHHAGESQSNKRLRKGLEKQPKARVLWEVLSSAQPKECFLFLYGTLEVKLPF